MVGRSASPLPVLIFDGDCGFCTRTARWIERRLRPQAGPDGPAPVPVQPWQALCLADFGLSEADVSTAAYWVDAAGHPWRGSQGIARALVAMGQPWALAGWAMMVPPISWLARGVYRLIADNRHRLPGSTDACRLP